MKTPFQYRLIEFTEYFTPDGEVYSFNNSVDKFLINGVSGMGMPDINYRTQRGPFQDGETLLGFTIQPRLITLVHRRNTNCRQEYWDARNDILDFLRPNRQESGIFTSGSLRQTQPDGTQREINVIVDVGPEFPGVVNGRWEEFSFQQVIRFIAHDPTFFDPSQNLLDLTLPTTDDELQFSIEFPIKFSSDGSVPTDSITYLGTYKSFPTIIMQGPLKEPVVQNITTGEKIKLDTTITDGRTVTINLDFGNKTIVDDLGNNFIGFLTVDSDLANFHIAPNPEAPSGVNQIGIAAQNTGSNSRIALKYFTRYIGI